MLIFIQECHAFSLIRLIRTPQKASLTCEELCISIYKNATNIINFTYKKHTKKVLFPNTITRFLMLS